MAEKLENQLKEVGSKLQNHLPTSKDALINLLTEAASCLSEMDQSPPKELLDAMQPLFKSIVKPELLKHDDEQVKLLVASCTCEITRITAPEPPYEDDVLKDIFHLFVTTFDGLRDTKHPSFGTIVNILDTVAKYRSFVVMLDLECDDLVIQMFKTFFALVSDDHPETVTVAMEIIMAVLLEESEDIGEDLLLIVLSILGRHKKDISPAARRLAMNVIGKNAGQLEAGIKQFILSSISGDISPSTPHIDYHEVIYDIYRCAPQSLSQIVPYLTRELQTDKIDIRLKAVKLVGELFSLQGSSIPRTFDPIFLEFLKRLTDNIVEVRMSVLEHVKLCLLSDPLREEAPKLVAALCDLLLDDDEIIRKQVVAAVSDVASKELSSISFDTLKLVAERLEDKSRLVKRYTMERLSDIYRAWCLKHNDGLDSENDYDWIPGRILRCSYDKDIRPETVEQIICTSLFPVEFSVGNKVKNWVKLFSKFDKLEVKALEEILEQKQRLQVEVQNYLSLRQTYKDNDTLELQKKTTLCIRSISHYFVDPVETESDLQLLDQSKDTNVWRILTTLLDPNTSSVQSRSLRDELLKMVGEKDPPFELLNTLSMKCSYIIFDKDFVRDLLMETDLQKCDGNRLLTQSCMDILVILARFSPLLLSGTEENLVHLLEDDDETVKEGVLQVLAKAGETIGEQLGESSSSFDLILERVCVEGSRRHAKYAIHALAAITKDEGLKSLSVLYKRLVEMLEKKTNLPSVLQSLGCIAQIAMPVFETQESKIEGFIRKDILRCSQKAGDKAKESWDNKSEICLLKVFGIKTLVKSYLPVKDAHLRVGIDELIKDLQSILSFGEISKDVESSSVDKAHLKLASAKAIIRLSKHWDKKIPVNIFHLTLRTSEAGFSEVRKLFLNKVHQYIKDRSLDLKYVCAFLLDFRPQNTILEENLNDIIQMSHQGKTESLSCILPHLVHALANHPSFPNIDECKDVKAYEPIYRKLYIFFAMLALGDEDGKPGVGPRREEIISINSYLRNIKRSKDAVNTNMSMNSYAICDLCLSITKRLAQKQEDLHESIVSVSLPQVLYTSHIKKEDEKKEEIEEDSKKEEIKEDEKKEADKEDKKKEEINEDEKKDEIDMEVSEGQTWLADEKAVAHFESLILEANGNIPSKIGEEDIMKDSETDGNEMPLGKVLKRLKAKGSKAKKLVYNGSTPAGVETDNSVDILGMLKEINLDNVDVSTKFESSNGHGKIKSEARLKSKDFPNDLTNVCVPKRQRSSAKGQKRSTFLSGFKSAPAFKTYDDPHSGTEDKVTSGKSTDPSHVRKEKSRNTIQVNLEKRKYPVETEKSGPIKKRKRRRVSGLTKCTMEEAETKTPDLVGKRIRVWWPMDKAFYGGLVKSYDHQKKKHVVLYDDGDVEVLYLDKERWELIENGDKSRKRKQLSDSRSPKGGGSSKKKIKSSPGISKQTKESTDISPSSMVRGKRTPRKNLKQGQKGVSQRAAYLEMGRSPAAKPTTLEEPLSNRQTGSSTSEEDLEKVGKSKPKEKQTTYSESSSSEENESDDDNESDKKENASPESSTEISSKEDDEIHKSDSEGNEEEEKEDAETPDQKGSSSDGSDDSDKAKFSDDEPLGVWKSRVGKGK